MPNPTKDTILALHSALLAADHTYSEQPTEQHHHNILAAQRIYYASLARYIRNTTPPTHQTDILLRRIHWIIDRATLNMRREKQHTQWQAIAHEQYQRAKRLRMRADALIELGILPNAEPAHQHKRATTPRTTSPTPSTRKRTIHPITGRYVYTDDNH